MGPSEIPSIEDVDFGSNPSASVNALTDGRL